MVRIHMALMRSLRASTSRVASTPWDSAPTFGLLQSSLGLTRGDGTSTIVRDTGITTVRRAGTPVVVLKIFNHHINYPLCIHT